MCEYLCANGKAIVTDMLFYQKKYMPKKKLYGKWVNYTDITWFNVLIITMISSVLMILSLCGFLISPHLLAVHMQSKNLPPTFIHLFGTDWLGRDIFFRTAKALSNSLLVIVLASVLSALLGTFNGLISIDFLLKLEKLMNWGANKFMGLFNISLMVLISMLVGGGLKGIIIAIALTQWASFSVSTRKQIHHIVLGSQKSDAKKVMISSYDLISRLFFNIILGIVLIIPNVFIYVIFVTFLGFGFSSTQLYMSTILREGIRFLFLGTWWVAFFPSIIFMFVIIMWEQLGKRLNRLMNN